MENYYKDQVGHTLSLTHTHTHTRTHFSIVLKWTLQSTHKFQMSYSIISLFQFSLLAEKLAQEREEIQVRKKAQEKVNSLLL